LTSGVSNRGTTENSRVSFVVAVIIADNRRIIACLTENLHNNGIGRTLQNFEVCLRCRSFRPDR
jgi:hypothetical protein